MFGTGGMALMACCEAQGLGKQLRCLAGNWVKEGPSSPSGTGEVKIDFSLVPENLSFRHAQILLPVRGFWDLPCFFNLFYFVIFFLLIPDSFSSIHQFTNKGFLISVVDYHLISLVFTDFSLLIKFLCV